MPVNDSQALVRKLSGLILGYESDPNDIKNFHSCIKFINAEWGVELKLIED